MINKLILVQKMIKMNKIKKNKNKMKILINERKLLHKMK